MRARTLLVMVFLATGLGACSDLDLGLFSDDTAPLPNGCTAAGCPQAAEFCTARGYHPGTDGYNRCIASVEENLRKGQ